jgi:hypothetical protein
VPADVEFHLCIPLGYPRGKFGLTDRLPTAETTYLNHWSSACLGGSSADCDMD